MGRYRGRDLLTVPGLLSLARVPLAASFPLVVHLPWAAFTVLGAAGLSDLLDGWWARRYRQVTATGAALDPLTDKIFVLTVATTLLVTERLTVLEILLLATRELGELPLVLWILASRRARRARAADPTANAAGKLATLLQFIAVAAALSPIVPTAPWVAATAVAGVFAALTYWRRALRYTRSMAPS